MPDYDKIGREVRAIFTAFPVEPETEEGRMVADLRYPGWREKGVPPQVPTPEAVERWGNYWWVDTEDPKLGHVVALVWMLDGNLVYAYVGNHWPDPVDESVAWLGPVLERPVKP